MAAPDKKPEKQQPKKPPVVQTVVKTPGKGKATIAQIKALQQQRKEQAQQLAEAKAQIKAQEEKRAKAIQEAREEIEKVTEEKKTAKKTTDSLRRFSFVPKKASPDTGTPKDVEKEPEAEPLKTHNGTSKFKSPICCVLGHVDTGKTKLLDKLRESNVQESEAGGITQQIGATFFPAALLSAKYGLPCSQMPGILIIDTPGHESFSNLRSRGSSLCNLAILIVDILHGLEPQTIESIQLLRDRRTPFIVALNKIDRIYEWSTPSQISTSFPDSLQSQTVSARSEFESLSKNVMSQLASHGFNTALFFENQDPRKVVSCVPVSAVTGEGVSELVSLIFSLSERFMSKKVLFSERAECTVLEVKHTEGFGVTLDVIVSNGVLREGDLIGINGTDGPIFTTIKTLLIPQPLKELRVKSQYTPVKEVSAAVGVKISAQKLETSVPGSRLVVIGNSSNASCDSEEIALKELEEDINGLLEKCTASAGVVVAASTIGSLEALLAFLEREDLPVVGTVLGKLKKRDVLLASLSAEKKYRTVLCFNMKVDSDIALYAENLDVKIFTAEIIYHLMRDYTAYMNALISSGKAKHASEAVFPVKIRVLPNCVFNSRSPLVLGVEVAQGKLKLQTPVCVFQNGTFLRLGTVTSMKENNKPVTEAGKGVQLAIKIEIARNDTPRMFGRHLDYSDPIYSFMTRESIALLKEYFNDELTEEHMELLSELETKFAIL